MMILNRRRSEVAKLFTDLFNAGFSDEEIGKELGYSVKTVKQYRYIFGLSRTMNYGDNKHQQMVLMYNEGLNISAIAKHFGCNRGTVKYWIRKLKEVDHGNV